MKNRPNPGIAPADYYDQGKCPVRAVLSHLGDKWSLIVMSHLKFGTHRFSELQGGIPDISQRMLTQTLRKLEREGLVSRHVTPTIPPRVDYAVTKLGLSLFEPLDVLTHWANEKRSQIEQARAAFDERT